MQAGRQISAGLPGFIVLRRFMQAYAGFMQVLKVCRPAARYLQAGPAFKSPARPLRSTGFGGVVGDTNKNVPVIPKSKDIHLLLYRNSSDLSSNSYLDTNCSQTDFLQISKI